MFKQQMPKHDSFLLKKIRPRWPPRSGKTVEDVSCIIHHHHYRHHLEGHGDHGELVIIMMEMMLVVLVILIF